MGKEWKTEEPKAASVDLTAAPDETTAAVIRARQKAALAVEPPDITAPTPDQWATLMAKMQRDPSIDAAMAAALGKLADALNVQQTTAADVHAQAMKKAMRPENEVAPGVSVFNPMGDNYAPSGFQGEWTAKPKPRCDFFIGPYPICSPGDTFTVTRMEIELLNRLEPGTYTVTKSDGLEVKMHVTAKFKADGRTYESIMLSPPIRDDEQKANWPPLVQILTEAVTGESPAHSYARLERRIAELEADNHRLQAAGV